MMILSEAELEELTGYKRPGEQTTWMQQNGFVFRIGGDGKIKVLREHVASVMSGAQRSQRVKRQPDFSVINHGS